MRSSLRGPDYETTNPAEYETHHPGDYETDLPNLAEYETDRHRD
jgi:hypothetical protein